VFEDLKLYWLNPIGAGGVDSLGGSPSERGVTSMTTKPATSGMPENAASEHQTAITGMSAKSVRRTIRKVNAKREKQVLEPHAKRPRYTHRLLRDDNDDILSATAQWSLTADPILPVHLMNLRILLQLTP